MIYNQNVYVKEKKQAYIEERESKQALIWRGIIIALCTFAGHFMLQTLTYSVLMDTIPELMMPSHFSVLSLYILFAFFIYGAAIAKFYNYLTFAEIAQNRWYTLVKLGYEPLSMIFVKICMRIREVFIFYTIGFFATIFLTLFLKYPFVSGYMLPLYLVGLVDLLILTIITMTCSLFIREQKNARYIILLSMVCILFLRISSRYYDLISNRELMNTIYVVKDIVTSGYFISFIIILIICVAFIFYRAKRIAQYTSFPFYKKDMDMEEDIHIVVMDGDDIKIVKDQRYLRKTRNRVIDRLVHIGFTLMICIGIIVNLFVLFVSLSSPERETNFFGVIPFVFHTQSMEPEIMYNDLAFFTVTDAEHGYEVGDIILYRDDYEPVVSEVVRIENGRYYVDILNYPNDVTQGRYEKPIDSNMIYGLYAGRNRWLGMIILFANTILGRLLLLLIPVALIYYYKPVIAYMRKKGYLID